MRKFDYRAPRFLVDLPVRLTFADSTQIGLCTEISTEGMTIERRTPLSQDSLGAVYFDYQSMTLELPVRVAHTGPTSDGVSFMYQSDEQRDELRRLVALLAAARHRSGPSLPR